MDLPKKKLIKVTYTYADGEEFYLDEENTAKFNKNIETASIHFVTHGGKFQSLEWKGFTHQIGLHGAVFMTGSNGDFCTECGKEVIHTP